MQNNEQKDKAQAQAESQARSTAFLFNEVAKYFEPTSYSDTYTLEGAQRERDREAQRAEYRAWGYR